MEYEECTYPYSSTYKTKDGKTVTRQYTLKYKRKTRSKGITDEDVEFVLRRVREGCSTKEATKERRIAYQTFLQLLVPYAVAHVALP